MFFHNSHEGFDRFGPGPMRGFGHGFGPGKRIGRGMIESAILRTLMTKPMHGYEIITQLEEETGGMWRPSPGSIYPTLQLLEEKNLVVSHDDSGKKMYELSDQGKKQADKAGERHEHWKEMLAERKAHHGPMHDVFRLIRHIRAEGSEEQNEQLDDTLAKLKSELETILR